MQNTRVSGVQVEGSFLATTSTVLIESPRKMSCDELGLPRSPLSEPLLLVYDNVVDLQVVH